MMCHGKIAPEQKSKKRKRRRGEMKREWPQEEKRKETTEQGKKGDGSTNEFRVGLRMRTLETYCSGNFHMHST
jgi:hypothetical protein